MGSARNMLMCKKAEGIPMIEPRLKMREEGYTPSVGLRRTLLGD